MSALANRAYRSRRSFYTVNSVHREAEAHASLLVRCGKAWPTVASSALRVGSDRLQPRCRVPKVSSRCITESKRLRSRPDSRERRARCSGDHEVICWMPKHARVPANTPVAAACSSLDLRPIAADCRNLPEIWCEFPGFTVASGGPLPRRG